VLSWVYHPKALPLAVPAATVHMAAMRGMEVVVLRPEGFALPPQIMDKARRPRPPPAARSPRPRIARGARRRERAVRQGMGHHPYYGDMRGGCAHARRSVRLVRARTLVRGRARPTPSSCIACRCAAMSRWPMKFWTARAPWSSARPSIVWWCRWPFCTACWPDRLSFRSILNDHESTRPFRRRARAQERGALHPHVQEQGVRHQGRRRRVQRRDFDARLIEQVAILHQVGIKTVLVHGGGPQLDSMQATLGIDTRMVNGRRVTDQKSIDVTAMVLNGLINTRILAICRELDIEAIGLSGVDAGLIRAHKRPPVRIAEGSSETVDYGFVGDIDSVNAA
jgi:hypothetical protein